MTENHGAALQGEAALRGRAVWITGASRGLGRSLALAFASAGAELLLGARSAEALSDLAAEIRVVGGVAEIVAGSIADAKTLARCAAVAESRWGALDVLVNNAGISPAFVRAERLDEADWREVLEVNLSAAFACCRTALPLLEVRGGSIVNVSSVHGTHAHERLVAYAASKGGIEMLTRTLAVEWATRGIRVNAVAPGYIETDMAAGLLEHPHWRASLLSRIPLGRFATTTDIAPAVLFLAGPGAGYITGTTLRVDGGWAA